MEKKKLTLSYIVHHWKSLSTSQKRAVLTLAMFCVAAFLITVTLIIAFSTCTCSKNRAQQATEAVEPIPELLRPPQHADRQQAEPDPIPDAQQGEADPDGEGDPDDEPDDTQTEESEETGSEYQTLKKKDRGEAVTELQERLMELGYLEIEEPTDYYGTSTEYAVSLFQRQHDLEQDGVAGAKTQALLYSKDAKHYTMFEGAEGHDVKMLQEQLVDLGYLSADEVDRIYGEKTVEAVKAFQKRNGLTADGKAGEKTLEKMFGESAKPSKEMEEKLKAEEQAAKEKEKAAKATPKPTSKSKTTPKPTSKTKTTPKPSSKTKTTPKPTKKPTATPKKDTKLEKFLKAANSKIGCEYVLGAKGPNKFDCSGFVYWCLTQAGVSTTRMDANNFSKVSRWKNITDINDLKKGDLLFFKSDNSSRVSHTGIYIGGGMMIDASSSNGKVVKRALSPYFKRNFVNARRPWE